jgi:hypothetical protein
MSYLEESVGFQFFNLTKAEADELSTHIKNAIVRSQHRQPDKYAVTFRDMTPEEDYTWLEALIEKYGLSEDRYRFFISFLTKSDRNIVAMPKFARALFRRIGGQIDFSGTYNGKYPDDEGDGEGVVKKPEVS